MRITLSEYDAEWPRRFAAYSADLRSTLTERIGDRLDSIHHIGSTAVPSLAAKDVIDIQVSISGGDPSAAFEPFEPLREAIEVHGYRWLEHNPDRRKRMFVLDDRTGRRLVNLHVRPVDDFAAQAALLLRDVLRASESARCRYEATKRELATRDWPSVDDYAMAKGDTVWALLREADRWAAETGWRPDPSDA